MNKIIILLTKYSPYLREKISTKSIISKLIILLCLVNTLSAQDNQRIKEKLINYTTPVDNIYKHHEKFSDISIEDIKFENDNITFRYNGRQYSFRFDRIGANFSDTSNISNNVNIYTSFDQVYYIQKQRLSRNFSLDIFLGSHFIKDASLFSTALNIEYPLTNKDNLGTYINSYLEKGQTNLGFLYQRTVFDNIYIKTGLELNYVHRNWSMLEKYDYPEKDRYYELSNSFYSSFFLEPALEFTTGKITIRQSMVANFIFLHDEITGLAYHLRPVIKIGYKLF